MLSIKPSYSTLSTIELLDKLIPSYRIENVKDCIYWERGFNDTYKIVTEEQNYILRVYRFGWRTLEEIEFEVEALLYLKDKNADISYPIMRRDGGYITPINAAEGVRYALVTMYAKGEPFAYDDLDDAYLYGVNVAKIHSCSEGFLSKRFRPELDSNLLIKAPLKLINQFLDHRPEDLKFINYFSSILAAYLDEACMDSLDYGFCHGDFHGWNAHKSLHRVEFFDFDFCGFGLRAYDLAVFRWSARLGGKEEERWNEFVRGYKSLREISEADLNLTTVFIGIRDIWLIAKHIEGSNVLGSNWLNSRYFDKRMEFLKKLYDDYFDKQKSSDKC